MLCVNSPVTHKLLLSAVARQGLERSDIWWTNTTTTQEANLWCVPVGPRRMPSILLEVQLRLLLGLRRPFSCGGDDGAALKGMLDFDLPWSRRDQNKNHTREPWNSFSLLYYMLNNHPAKTQFNTSLSIPNLGNGHILAEHLAQKTCPQARQWCWRVTIPKATRQRWQTSPSAQSGAVSASNMASASLTAGNVQPSAFIKFNVSWKQQK